MSDDKGPGPWSFVLDNYLLLMTRSLAALTWANENVDSYERFTHVARLAVNDVGMVFFFALALILQTANLPPLRSVSALSRSAHPGAAIMVEERWHAV